MDEALAATIAALNDHPERVNLPAYRENVHANYDVCEGAATVISDFVAGAGAWPSYFGALQGHRTASRYLGCVSILHCHDLRHVAPICP